MSHERRARRAGYHRSLAPGLIGVIAFVVVLLCGVLIGLGITAFKGSDQAKSAASSVVQSPVAKHPAAQSGGAVPSVASFPSAASTGFTKAPGYPGKLTDCSSLIVKSNTTYRFCNFPDGLFVGSVTQHPVNVTFIGCRFASNSVVSADVADYGRNITFSYSTFEPSTVAVGSEPVSPRARPVSAAASYQYAVDLRYDGGFTIDHSDIWGFGDGIQFSNSSKADPVVIENSWIHNPSLDPTGQAHVDAILNSYGGISYMTFNHNTIVGNGNTQALGLQGSSAYKHVTITNNYFSGYGYTICVGIRVLSTDIVFTGNVLASALEPTYGPIYSSESFSTPGLGNVWRDNKFYVVPGTSWLAAKNSGLYWWPTDTNPSNSGQVIGHATDYPGA